MASRRHGAHTRHLSDLHKPLPRIPRKELPAGYQPAEPRDDLFSPDPARHHIAQEFVRRDESKPFFRRSTSTPLTPYHNRNDSLPPAPSTPRRAWRPFFLRRSVIGAFAVVFAILALASGLLLHVSRQGKGISSTSNSYHYFWTYGPTALFLIIDAVWYQVDYAARAAMPWFAMAQPAAAEDSVLLEYISKPPVVTLVAAFRRRHFLVVLSNTVGLLLKLLSILATGFFVLNLSIPVSRPASMALTNSFTPNNASAILRESTFADLGDLAGPFPYASLYLSEVLQIPSLSWATDNGSFVQSFALGSDQSVFNATISATVDVFKADLGSCEPATAALSEGYDVNFPPFFQANMSACDGTAMILTGAIPTNGSSILFGQMAPFYCNDEAPGGDPLQPSTVKLALFFANASETAGTHTGMFNTYQATALVCEPSYCIYPADVSLDPSGSISIAEPLTRDCRQLPGVTNANLTQLVLNSNSFGDSTLQEQLQWPTDPPMSGDLSAYIALKNQHMAISDPKQLFDAATLQEAFGIVYSGIAANIAAQSFTADGLLNITANDTTVMGAVTSPQDRLVVNAVSFGLVVAVLLVNMGLCIALLFIVPRNTPCRPGSLGGVASVLSHSGFTALFANRGIWPASSVRRVCDEYSFVSRGQVSENGEKSWRVDSVPTRDVPPTPALAPDQPKEETWWHPPAQSLYYGGSLAALLITLIIVLEVVHHISATNDGLGNVNPQEGARFAWTYVPALLMTITTLLAQGLNTTVKIVEPYSLLRRKNASGHDALLNDYSGESSFFSIPRSLIRGRIAMLASTVGLCVGPILTVAVGGLFSPQAVSYTSMVPLIATKTFNFTGLDTLANSAPSVLPNTANASVVSFYELRNDNITAGPVEYGHTTPFMPFEPESRDPFFADSTVLNATVPLLRLGFGCGDFPYSSVTPQTDVLAVNISLDLPPECPPLVTDDSTSVGLDGNFLTNETISLVPWSPSTYNTSFFGMTMWQMPNVTKQPVIAECPFMIGMYGRTNDQQQVDPSDLIVVACQVPNVSSTTAELSFDLPSLAPLDPNRFDEPLPNGPLVYETDISFVLGSFLVNAEQQPYDTTVSAMLAAVQANFPHANASEMLLDRQTFVDTLLDVWDQSILAYMTFLQTVDAGDAANGTLAIPPDFVGVFENPYRARLVQSEISTRILQGVLGLMLACVALTYAFLDRGDYLPMNPCSIAAKASLLAGSKAVRGGAVPPGAEWLSDRDLRKTGVFSTESFSLGWWGADRRSAAPTPDTRLWKAGRVSWRGGRVSWKGPRVSEKAVPESMDEDDEQRLRYGIDAEEEEE